MSSRIFARNAFETGLDGGISDSETTITLDTTVGLSADGILVINDDSPTLREYVEYTGIATNDLTGCTRGLSGSAAGTAHAHGTGARVRSVYVHQIQDRIWDDIEALETADTDHVAAGDPHTGYVLESAHNQALHDALSLDHAALSNLTVGDPHTQYVEIAGDTMTGLLVLSGAPVADLNPASKVYTDGLITTHEGLSNPHAIYLTQAEADALYLALTGTADDALKWLTARTITLAGDLTGAVVLDGSGNVVLTAVVVNDSHTHDTRYFTEGESDSRFVNHTGDQVMTGKLTVESNTRIEHSGTQTKIRNLASGGKTLVIGTASIAPEVTKDTDLGSSTLRFNRIFADLAPGGSVPDTVRYRTSDGQLFDGASTRALKKNIRPLEGSERIYDLKPVSFDWKADDIPSIGLIAEDTYPVIPEVVSLDAKGKPHGIAYDWLVSPMLAELQKLAARVKELESSQ